MDWYAVRGKSLRSAELVSGASSPQWTPLGRVAQQVVEQLLAADQQVGHPGARQPRLRHAITPATANGLLDFGKLPADIAHHHLGALAGGDAGSSAGRLLHGFLFVG